MVFQWQVTDTQENVDYAGIGGWTRVDALLTVNGVLHEKEGFHQSYLQYGAPAYRLAAKGSSGAEEADEEETAEEGTSNHLDVAEEAFAPVDMVGRIYGRYFPEWSTSVFFYVLASDEEVLENCDRDILSKSVIGENPS
jgi:hypothetical protein